MKSLGRPGRVRSTLARANQRFSLQLAAGLLAGSTFLSSLLGLFRDRLLNSTYAATYSQGLDAYTVAFIIPDFMFFLLVSGALSVTFIPVFNERLANNNKKSAWELSTSILNIMALAALVISVLIVIFAEPLVYLVAPGMNEDARALAVSLTRVIAINPFLFAVSSVVASMQQAVGRFTFFSLAPILYNTGIIIGITWFTNGITIFGFQLFGGGIMGVALGVVLGSTMQLLTSIVGLAGMGFDYRFKIFWKNIGFRQVLKLLPARSFDQGIDYFNNIVEVNLASRFKEGFIRAYQQATMLHMVPINLIGVAISTAAFPQMTERLSQGRPDLFRKELQSVLRVITWIAMPVTAITYFARGYVVSFIYVGGDTIVAGLLSILAIAILFRSIYHISARSFYAQQDTRTPLYISLFTISLNIGLAILFTMRFGFGIYGLAWAQVIVAIVEVAILFVIMSRRIPKLFDGHFIRSLWKMFIATAIMSIITYASVKLFELSSGDQSLATTLPKFSLITAISFSAYLYLSHRFKLGEARPIIARIKKVLFSQVPIEK